MCLGIFVFIHRISPLLIGKKNEKLSVLFLLDKYKLFFSWEKAPMISHVSEEISSSTMSQPMLRFATSKVCNQVSIWAQTFLIQFYQKQMICNIQFIAIYSYFRSAIVLFECVFLKKHLNQYLQALLSSERASINFSSVETWNQFPFNSF